MSINTVGNRLVRDCSCDRWTTGEAEDRRGELRTTTRKDVKQNKLETKLTPGLKAKCKYRTEPRQN